VDNASFCFGLRGNLPNHNRSDAKYLEVTGS
jgi:hypothetical protein